MSFNKKEFARFLLEEEVLLFGEFTLKSGRQSPHFFNSGRLDNGRALNRLGEFMAHHLQDLGGGDLFFGPAYKGIPLAVAVATAYSTLTGTDAGFLFNRKEVKGHGDGGLFVGRAPQKTDRIIVIDDVISSGLSLKESVQLLDQHHQVTPQMALVCVDRQEKGTDTELSAAQELKEQTGVPCEALVTLEEVVSLMIGQEINGKVVLNEAKREAVTNYLGAYGAS